MSTSELDAHRWEWIYGLTNAVLDLLPAGRDANATVPILAAEMTKDPVTHALLLTHIAVEDCLARSVEAIGAQLVASGVVRPTIAAEQVSEHLVWPVVHRVRGSGVPWVRWWDIRGLHGLLLELWTAQRRTSTDENAVREELESRWRIRDNKVVASLLKGVADPYALLPVDLGETSTTGAAKAAAARVTQSYNLEQRLQEQLADRSVELATRPDLVEVLRRQLIAKQLSALVKQGLRYPEDAELQQAIAGIRRDLEIWNDQFSGFLEALTAHELRLLVAGSVDVDFRDQCLNAGSNVFVASMLQVGSLPARLEPGAAFEPAPGWMQDEVISGGVRMWHGHVGPYPLWFVTAETDAQEAGFRHQLVDRGNRITFQTDASHVDMDLLVTVAGETDLLLHLPFTYDLDYASEAWDLLLLASIGGVRLTVLRLTAQGELLSLGAIWISLSSSHAQELSALALQSLRSHIGDDMGLLRRQLVTVDTEATAGATLLAGERAKGEDLLDELLRNPPPGTRTEEWVAFQQASRRFAQRHAERIRALADGQDNPALLAAVREAGEQRIRAREISRVRGDKPTFGVQLAALASALPDDHTAFVHLVTRGAFLTAVWLVRADGHPRVGQLDLRGVELQTARRLSQMWLAATDAELELAGLARQDLLRALHRGLAGLGAPLVETLQPLGVSRLILSPTGPFDLLPLHAAPTGLGDADPLLFEVFDEVLYAPSIRMLAAIGDQSGRGQGPPVIVAHSGTGIPGLRAISGPKAEAQALRVLYPDANVLLDEEATPARALAAARGARCVHFAGHGYADVDWYGTGLALQGVTRGDALLSAAQVLADGDFSGVQVTVLSACETGTYPSTAFVVQTLRGLDGPFFARGAHCVISTLWAVGDVSALAFSILLHAGLATGDTPVRSYRRAIRYLRDAGWRSSDQPLEPVAKATGLLDQVQPGWRDRLNREATAGIKMWGAFKITGLGW